MLEKLKRVTNGDQLLQRIYSTVSNERSDSVLRILGFKLQLFDFQTSVLLFRNIPLQGCK